MSMRLDGNNYAPSRASHTLIPTDFDPRSTLINESQDYYGGIPFHRDDWVDRRPLLQPSDSAGITLGELDILLSDNERLTKKLSLNTLGRYIQYQADQQTSTLSASNALELGSQASDATIQNAPTEGYYIKRQNFVHNPFNMPTYDIDRASGRCEVQPSSDIKHDTAAHNVSNPIGKTSRRNPRCGEDTSDSPVSPSVCHTGITWLPLLEFSSSGSQPTSSTRDWEFIPWKPQKNTRRSRSRNRKGHPVQFKETLTKLGVGFGPKRSKQEKSLKRGFPMKIETVLKTATVPKVEEGRDSLSQHRRRSAGFPDPNKEAYGRSRNVGEDSVFSSTADCTIPATSCQGYASSSQERDW